MRPWAARREASCCGRCQVWLQSTAPKKRTSKPSDGMGGLGRDRLAAIAGGDGGGLAVGGDAAVDEEADAVAEALHEVEVVGDDHDGAAVGPQLGHTGEA